MAELQRSAVTFRRHGSSGVVWDDKFFKRELINQVNHNNKQEGREKEEEFDVKIQHSRSATPFERIRFHGGQRSYHTGSESPAMESPSPKGLKGFWRKRFPHAFSARV